MAQRLIDGFTFGGLTTPPPGEADPPFLDLQNPAPLATGVLIGANIVFRVNDLGDGVDGTSIIVDIDVGSGFVRAYDFGGGFQNSYTGTVTPSGNGFLLDINPPADFPDLQVVQVRVRATDLSPLTNSLDMTYTFTSADGRPPFVTAQTPAPGATGILQNANIAFTVDDAASAVTLASIQVFVDQGGGGYVQAVLNGVIVAPFNGGGASVTPSGNGYAFVLDPTSNLIEQNTVSVRVSATDAVGNALSNLTYSFTTGDQTGPSIVPVSPLALATAAPTTNIVFDILDLGTGVDIATLFIEINEGSGFNNAYTGGAFVAPYNGPSSSIVAVANGFRVTVDPTSDLAPLQTISVHVTVDDVGGNSANSTYTFDTTNSGTVNAPVYVPNVGGGPVDMTGTIPVGDYLIYVGPAGDATDPQVYNGIPGSGGGVVTFEVIPNSGGLTAPTAPVYLPPLPVGGPYVFTLVPQPSGANINSNAIVTVLPENFSDKAFALRRMLPTWLAAGPRAIGSKRFPQS
jgi:hypothetical protein